MVTATRECIMDGCTRPALPDGNYCAMHPGMKTRMNGSLIVVEKGDARRCWTRSYVEVVVLPYVQKGHDWSLGYKLPSLDESEVLAIMGEFARHRVTA